MSRTANFAFDRLDVHARPVQAAGIDDLRGVRPAMLQHAVVALLALGEFRLRERVVPAEIIPVADRIGEGDDVRAFGELRRCWRWPPGSCRSPGWRTAPSPPGASRAQARSCRPSAPARKGNRQNQRRQAQNGSVKPTSFRPGYLAAAQTHESRRRDPSSRLAEAAASFWRVPSARNEGCRRSGSNPARFPYRCALLHRKCAWCRRGRPPLPRQPAAEADRALR